MKSSIIFTITFLLPLFMFSQKKHYNLSNGFVAEGYDVVAYFSNKSVKGKSSYSSTYEGLKFKFANEANRKTFESNPAKYFPQYGGYCAYAMGVKGEKVTVDPETFEIRGGKLFLFYNSFFNNTFESWKEEDPERLKIKADANWAKIISK